MMVRVRRYLPSQRPFENEINDSHRIAFCLVCFFATPRST